MFRSLLVYFHSLQSFRLANLAVLGVLIIVNGLDGSPGNRVTAVVEEAISIVTEVQSAVPRNLDHLTNVFLNVGNLIPNYMNQNNAIQFVTMEVLTQQVVADVQTSFMEDVVHQVSPIFFYHNSTFICIVRSLPILFL